MPDDCIIMDGGEPEPDQLDMEYHMPLLEDLASKASVVIEIGVGKGNGSTRAFRNGLKKSIATYKAHICVDQELLNPRERPAQDYARIVYGRSQDPMTVKVASAVLQDVIGLKMPADIIFIDTDHTYEQMATELGLWSVFAGPQTVWLAHDIFMGGQRNVMTDALKDYCIAHPEWEYTDVTLECHGLGMMKRK